jgi:tRNA A-37 threonylcarbamoyl transferase component Bud32
VTEYASGMADSTGDPVVGATLAGYRIERRLGRGGMSVVYLAEDLALGRKVALKVLAPELSRDQSFRERFRLESRLAASIDHPNVIPIYEAGEAEGQLYIAMRYVEGTDLRRLIDEEGALEPMRAVELIAHVADGLEAAHARGLVHRDVKPSNVLVAKPGEQEHAYLADFGLTKTAESEEEAKEVAQLSGTTDYVAPELITDAHAGTGADVYALGCVLYEALTGQVPFPRRSELETLVAHIDEPVPKPSHVRPELSSSLDAVVERAMAKDPDERYASAAELAAAARATLPAAGRSRRLALLLAAAAALLAGAALAAVLVTRSDPSGPNAPTTDLVGTGAIQRVDSDTGKLEATIRIPGQPLELATGSEGVWLADDGDDIVYRFDPDTYERTIAGQSKRLLVPQTLVSAHDSIWLGASTQDGRSRLVTIASQTGGGGVAIDLQALADRSGDQGPPVRVLSQLIPVPSPSSAGMFDGWVLDAAEGALRRFGAVEPPALSSPIDTDGTPHVTVVANGELWVGQGNELVTLVGDRIVSRTRLPGTPVGLAAGTHGVWAAIVNGMLVLVERDGTIARTVRTPGRPVDLEPGDDSVWLLTRRGRLTKLDSNTGETLAVESVGNNAVAVAVGAGSVWVAVRGGNQLERSRLPHRLQATTGFTLTVPLPCGGSPKLGFLRNWDNCRNSFGIFMTAGDGSRAGYSGYFWERRVKGGAARCKGKTYRGPATSDVRDAGSGIVWIERWGTLAIHFDRMVIAADAVQGGPLCGVGTGTWIATAGPFKGERGGFTFLGPGRERIILR